MNIAEVARRAGVSRSTVSYVLSGNRPVSDETRARIQKVIDEIGYRPNATARALANGRTRSLAMVFPPASSHYTDMQLDFIGGVAESAAAFDHDVLLSAGLDGDRALRRLVAERRVDGAIIMEIRLRDERIDHLLETGFPFVTIGRVAAPGRTRWVDLDHSALTAACVRHLAELGHRTIAFVNRSERLFHAGYESAHRGLDGFTRTADELGLRAASYRCEDSAAAGEALIGHILADRPGTTALVTVNEAALGGLYRGLARAGLSVPRDFSLTGISASRWAEAVTPQLTAAEVPAHTMGRLAVELLLEVIGDPAAQPRHVLLEPPVSLRASTGAAPPSAP
jgi:DNA-binding LacI/PurR family transcriptional regulator